MVIAHHETLEEWAKKFGGTAILGFISTLLIGGKFVHHIFQRRGLVFGVFIIPPAIVSGLLGLIWFSFMEFLEPAMTADLRNGLNAIQGNLINFVFAALILGLTCGRSNSQHNTSLRGILTSVLHEGMPMIIYSQILMWGQSTCCLTVLCILNYFNFQIPSLFPAMIPLGIEAGSDSSIALNYSSFWSETIVQEAESLGLISVSVVGILLFTFKPYFISKGWLGNEYTRGTMNNNSSESSGGTSVLRQGTGTSEAFERNRATALSLNTAKAMNRSFSSDNINPMNYKKETPRNFTPHKEPSHREMSGVRKNSDDEFYSSSYDLQSSPANIEEEIDYRETSGLLYKNTLGDDNNSVHSYSSDVSSATASTKRIGYASLGSHLSLIALTVFLSFGFCLLCHFLEIYYELSHHIFSSVRMFKLSMCCAFCIMIVILQYSNIRFNRDWFMRLCGLMLDLLFIAALAKSYPKPQNIDNQTHYLLCSVFVFICLAWNVFCFLYVARQLFPNYWFERAVTLSGDCMGHCYTGLLFARTLDPTMESPVPAAYAYKLMLFFIPSSNAKNTIVVALASSHGIGSALIVCLCVVVTWLLIFNDHFKSRFINNNGSNNGNTDIISSIIGTATGGSLLHKSKSDDYHSDFNTINSVHNDETIGISTATNENDSLLNRETSGNSSKNLKRDDLYSSSLKNDRGLSGISGLDLCDDDNELESGAHNSSNNINISNIDINNNNSNSPAVRRTSYAITNPTNMSNTNTNNANNLDFPLMNNSKYLTKVQCSEPSSIVTSEQMSTIASFLSDSKAGKSWKLAYSLRQHGANLSTMLSLTTKYNTYRHASTQRIVVSPVPCIIIIEDSWGYIFGGFVAPGLSEGKKNNYYGSGESFVFSVVPTPQVYKWTGNNDLFVLSNDKCFAMGGGGDGFGFQLDDELDTGVSSRSATFNNNTLSSSEFFKCLNVEVWILETTASGYTV